MTANDDENPHYDDLIRELRELKKFIESNGDNVISPQASADAEPATDDEPARPVDPPRADPKASTAAPQTEDEDEDDGPPTLREAVHRPPRRDEMQLDLLSVTRSDDRLDDRPDEEDAEPPLPRTPTGALPGDVAASPPAVDGRMQDAPDPEDAKDARPGDSTSDEEPADDDALDEDADEEVVRFVLDLSDRILATIEDKLLEHSGELLPGAVRGELREAIGDILYEWCER